MPNYRPQEIEARWQAYWERERTFRCPDPDELTTPTAGKLYILDMFPYPSGDGLHVGHVEGYTATDILARYQRMRGKHVLHPMGWDAFGLPAEQHAIQTGTHPRLTTAKNIDTFRRQIKSLGLSYDWQREVDTTDPQYVRWTQWIFLQIYDTWYDPVAKRGRPIAELPIPPEVADAGPEAVRRYQDAHRLAYQAEVPVNWCAELGTVLANEEVIDGKSERGGYPVVRIPLRQWLLRITAYADRLIDDLDLVDWSDGIKRLQREWIGKSEGAEVTFALAEGQGRLTVYTTRPDTLFGATYMVLAPEHPLVPQITTPAQQQAVAAYREQTARKSERERIDEGKKKTGVPTGAFAINPVNGERIPIWIADYVLATYGTGAIMAVPAHDERDYAFARQYGLPIRPVVRPADGSELPADAAYTEPGIAINSGPFDGLATEQFKQRITDWLQERGLGKRQINYKLRDWLFSRQRYWGEPFPILHELDEAGQPTGLMRPVPESELPLNLPELADFKPTGSPEGPLAKVSHWVNVCIDGKRYRRETNTMPQWAGSCWYYLRYLDPHNQQRFCDPAKAKYWLPVDVYIGGAEHAVLHLLYARFWHKVLYDRGYLPTPEPFQKLVNQGMILGENGEKMSKSRGNVVNPDEVIAAYGADSLRLFEMFMGPLEASKPWSTQGVEGVYRFLSRVWRLVVDDAAEQNRLAPTVQPIEPDRATLRQLHRTIQRVTDDLDHLRFNTAIAAMMEYTNYLTPLSVKPRAAIEPFVLLLAPFAPHLAEELWQVLGHQRSLAYEPWPSYDPAYLVEDTVEVPVQVNGKLRTTLTVPVDISDADLQTRALADERVRSAMAGKDVKKIILTKPPRRLVNIVV